MSRLSLIFSLAWRYFRARRERGFVSLVTGFSLAGLAVGVAALIISIAVFTGFRLELRQRIYDIESPIRIEALDGHPFQWRELYSTLATQTPGVSQVIPYVNAPTLVFKGDQARGALVRGMRWPMLAAIPLASYVIAGDISPNKLDGDLPPALVGTGLAADLNLELGDEFRAYRGGRDDINQDFSPSLSSVGFFVAGLLKTGIEEVDQRLLFTTPEAARALTGLLEGPFYHGAQIYLDDALRIDKSLTLLTRTMAEHALIPQSTLAYEAVRDNKVGFSAADHLKLAEEQEAALIVILSLIVVVATFGVVAAQVMKVQEKAREIAVLRSFGADSRLVLQVFILLGFIVGLMGSLLGLGLGLLIAVNLNDFRLMVENLIGISLFPADQFRLAFLPARPTVAASLGSVIIAILLTVIAVIYPAFRAARVNPAEALRYA